MRERLGSLRARLVAYVFFIMTAASLFTSVLYVFLYSSGILRPMLFTHMMAPVWMVCVSSIIGTVITAWLGDLQGGAGGFQRAAARGWPGRNP